MKHSRKITSITLLILIVMQVQAQDIMLDRKNACIFPK